MIQILVNGTPKSIAENLSAEGLIESLGLSPKAVIVEYNGTVIKADEWAKRLLSEGDRLELIQIVGGG
jgi:sulfur carrier protein